MAERPGVVGAAVMGAEIAPATAPDDVALRLGAGWSEGPLTWSDDS